jgi:hypothetical protein
MSTTAAFASTPRVSLARISAANTNRDGTGTIVTAFVPGANGSRIERIRVKANAVTTAGQVRLFLSVDSGVTWRLFQEIAVSAATPSATVQSWEGNVTLGSTSPLFLPATAYLGASTHNAEAFEVTTIGGDI